MSNNPNECPRCATPLPEVDTLAGEWAQPDVYACQCEEFIYVRPYGEWFARWNAILSRVAKIKVADPQAVEEAQAAFQAAYKKGLD